MRTGLEHRSDGPLRAPEASGGLMIEPPLQQASSLIAENRSLRAVYDYDVQGRRLAQLSRQAREHLVTEALRWTTGYRDVNSQAVQSATGIFLAGHQPQLFHPGVWLKNFALDALARQHSGVAINLLIDTDTIKQTAIAVPGGSASSPTATPIEIDRPGEPVPLEDRGILDRELFNRFGSRVAEQIAPLVSDPLIRDYWPLVVERSQQVDNLGACLAQSRHKLEADWGLSTLEVPESVVSTSEPFCWFAAHLLAQLPAFRTTYNEAVQEYRQANRIRSSAHPVPDLGESDGWLEAPFWIWTADDPIRRRLFAKYQRDRILICDQRRLEFSLPLTADGLATWAVQRLAEMAGRGVKIRPRALLTTLWARLVLGDMFLHGIGGAKYDRVTDRLIERFFGLAAPRFLVASGTLHLPVDHLPTTGEDAQAVGRQLRELTYHPECHVDQTQPPTGSTGEDAAELIAAKRRLVATPETPENARYRYLEFRRVNRALQPWVDRQRSHLLTEQSRIARGSAAESILSSRDYAFCLFPKKTLREFLAGLLPKNL